MNENVADHIYNKFNLSRLSSYKQYRFALNRYFSRQEVFCKGGLNSSGTFSDFEKSLFSFKDTKYLEDIYIKFKLSKIGPLDLFLNDMEHYDSITKFYNRHKKEIGLPFDDFYYKVWKVLIPTPSDADKVPPVEAPAPCENF